MVLNHENTNSHFMLDKIINFPTQLAEAFDLAKDIDLPLNYEKNGDNSNNLSNIVVLGMGGSGIVGDFLRVLLRRSAVPVHVIKNSHTTRFINEKSLVFAITHSGKTRETLDALERCIHSGAKIVCVTSSHELKCICDKKRIQCIQVSGNAAPRASLGYLLVPLLCMLTKTEILPKENCDIDETITVLKMIRNEYRPELPLDRNPVQKLALNLLRRFPVIYGEYNFTDIIALRWKQVLNENAKIHCYYDAFPELAHNEIETWTGCDNNNNNHSSSGAYSVILLRDFKNEHETNLGKDIEATKYILDRKGVDIFEFQGRGESELSRLLSLSYIGDFASIYLAMARELDAFATHNINFIKRFRLAEGDEVAKVLHEAK